MFVDNIIISNVNGNFGNVFGYISSLAVVTFRHILQFFLEVITSKLCVNSNNM